MTLELGSPEIIVSNKVQDDISSPSLDEIYNSTRIQIEEQFDSAMGKMVSASVKKRNMPRPLLQRNPLYGTA